MFTGIIKAKGTITPIERRGGDVRLTVSAAELPWADYAIGDSISRERCLPDGSRIAR